MSQPDEPFSYPQIAICVATGGFLSVITARPLFESIIHLFSSAKTTPSSISYEKIGPVGGFLFFAGIGLVVIAGTDGYRRFTRS